MMKIPLIGKDDKKESPNGVVKDRQIRDKTRLVPKPLDTDYIEYGLRALFPEPGKVNLAAVSEIPPRMILPFLRMVVSEAALDRKRTTPLSVIFRESFFVFMIGKDRRGRIEILTMTQPQTNSEFGGGSEQQVDLRIGDRR